MTRTIICLILLAATAAIAAEAQTGEMSVNRVRSKLFRHQYTIYDREFCGSEVCVDFDNDGRRELLYVSRTPGKLQLLNAADGSVRWSRELKGQQQPTSAFDLDGDGRWKVLYTVSDPGVLHRLNPLTLESVWSFTTNDNASSADAVLVDIDGKRLWKVEGLSEEDSPNVADLDGDGSVEIVGMTIGGEVYCLDAKGQFRWRRDLRSELDDGQHMYMTPILCDLNAGHVRDGRFLTELLTLPPDCEFRRLQFAAETPAGTQVRVDVLDSNERPLFESVSPVVDARDLLRIDAPVSVPLSIKGEMLARPKRSYRIDAGAAIAGPVVSVDRRPDFLVVRVGEFPILQYNSAHVEPPAGVDARYGRSAFIHPLWTPAGTVVTDQFPPDHLHQSGIFLAHTKTEFEGRTPNFWDSLGGTGRVRFKEVKGIVSGPVFGELQVEHEHVDLSAPDAKVALVESWSVRVWNVGGRDAGFWMCDVSSTLNCATPDPLRLLKYHYGGMALRGARSWDAEHARFLTSEGKDRVAGNHTRPRWCDLFGPVGDRTAGIAFLTHPANFRAPEPLRIHPTMPYMVYSPSHLGDWEITPRTPHVSRYQFVIHDGNLPETTTSRLWLNFAEPHVPSAIQFQ